MRLTRSPVPHIAIPTTAGTGSEVTNIAVIKNHDCNRKVYILENLVFPQVAILDPEFVMSMPPGLTAATGMDALTHAIEAISSIRSNPVCDAQALHAIRLIKHNLPRCVKDGNDMKARSLMQIAATLAGWSFTIAQVGLAHAMAHTVGAIFNVPHGVACGVILPHVMRFNQEHCPDKMVMVAEALGIKTYELTDSEAASMAANRVQEFLDNIGHPQRLRDVGMTEDAIYICAEHTLADPACIFNPRPVTDQGMAAEVFEQAY
jgi:alcohol dehydrogenase class IV